MEAGAAIDKAMDDGCTPLLAATEKGLVDIVSILLERGADSKKADNDGVTPRSAAVNPEIIEMLEREEGI